MMKQAAVSKSQSKIKSSDTSTEGKSELDLIWKLFFALKTEGVSYCLWKSSASTDRSAMGEGDLDLLVSRSDAELFSEILYRLEFKQVSAPKEKQMPGVIDYFGYDQTADKIIHLHVYYQLMVGDKLTNNYHLPIEKHYLQLAIETDLFRLPDLEFEFIVFIIRMVIIRSTWDAIISRQGNLKPAEKRSFTHLQSRIDMDRVHKMLSQYLPMIDAVLFENCLKTLQPTCTNWNRIKTGYQLQSKLQVHAQRSVNANTALRFWRRGVQFIRRRILKYSPKYQLTTGGTMIAVLGGDGSGKSTAVSAIHSWLSEEFETSKVHLGKPPWSWTTRIVRGIIKIGNLFGLYPAKTALNETLDQNSMISPGYPWMLREVCRARDRFNEYSSAKRFAIRGGLVTIDRFPHSKIQLMDGIQTRRFVRELESKPQANQFMSPKYANRLTKAIIEREERYYQQISSPEIMIVLRVDPEIAVQRKVEEEETYVRRRNKEIWGLDWDGTGVDIIDASQTKDEVLARIKSIVWEKL